LHNAKGNPSRAGSKVATVTGNTDPQPSVNRFTVESVYRVLLDKKVLLAGKRPSDKDPAFVYLAQYLNNLQNIARGWKETWREELANIDSAIYIITEILPKWHDDFAAEIACFYNLMDNLPEDSRAEYAAEAAKTAADMGWPEGYDSREERRIDLAALDALVKAASVARERGLPLAPMIALSMRIERWPHFAEHLQKIFRHVLPEMSKAASYRFIVAVTPDITGETPTKEAVRSQLMRNRPVNRGRRPS
jgi:hypothetical protein